MIFGQKQSFAIEADLVQGNQHVFIYYYYWLNGHSIGDYQQSVLLSSAIFNFESILKYKGLRNTINGIKPDEFVSAILNNEEFDDEKTYYFNINYSSSENMDGYYTFLFEMNSYEWLFFGDRIDEKYYQFKLPKGQFYKHISQLLNWISQSTTLVLSKSLEK